MGHLPIMILILDKTQGNETELFFNYYFTTYMKTIFHFISMI